MHLRHRRVSLLSRSWHSSATSITWICRPQNKDRQWKSQQMRHCRDQYIVGNIWPDRLVNCYWLSKCPLPFFLLEQWCCHGRRPYAQAPLYLWYICVCRRQKYLYSKIPIRCRTLQYHFVAILMPLWPAYDTLRRESAVELDDMCSHRQAFQRNKRDTRHGKGYFLPVDGMVQ